MYDAKKLRFIIILKVVDKASPKYHADVI